MRTAWHEAGHAVAAIAIGARFSSASIHHGPNSRGHSSEGRVHGVTGGGELSFVVDAAGQISERLMDWTMLGSDADLRAWLTTVGSAEGRCVLAAPVTRIAAVTRRRSAPDSGIRA